MRIGTRLTWVLLLCVTPVLAIYIDFSVRRATNFYQAALKREVHATARALEAALEPQVSGGDWVSVRSSLERIKREQVVAAIFDSAGKPRFALPDFPLHLEPRMLRPAVNSGVEFLQKVGGRRWLCRGVPLLAKNGKVDGILVVAVDWSGAAGDLRRRLIASVLAGSAVIILIALIIPTASNYYVGRPLAELSRRVTRFSSFTDTKEAEGDEVRLLSEEFKRLARELDEARDRLVKEGERKLELERQLRHSDRLATVGTLASGLAHEIGTPLNVIRGRAEHLMNGRSDPERIKAGLAVIVGQIDRISRIVRMLLDFGSRRDRAKFKRDLHDVIGATLSLLETEAERNGIRFEMALGDTPLYVRCDPDQLQQVFVNLGVNAIDAMKGCEDGVLKVAAEVVDSSPGQRWVQVSFEDNGPGVDSGNRERLFDPFFTTKEPGKGTGMGLAVSQSIIKDHGGRIEVESVPGRTRFTVVLQLLAPEPALIGSQA